jgi:hypothetical protein
MVETAAKPVRKSARAEGASPRSPQKFAFVKP